MSEPTEHIPERVTRLEHEMAEARKDAAAARILAGGADRDVSEMRTELRAHTKSLQALRETQIEQGNSLADLRTEMRDGFARVDAEMHEGFTEMREGFSMLKAGQVQITMLLNDAVKESDETDTSESADG